MFNITYEKETEIEVLEGVLRQVYGVLFYPNIIDVTFFSSGINMRAFKLDELFFIRVFGEVENFKMQFEFYKEEVERFGDEFFRMASNRIIHALCEYNKNWRVK